MVINYNGIAETFFLRKQSSLDVLKTFKSQWDFYTRLFRVQSKIDGSNVDREIRVGMSVSGASLTASDFSTIRNYSNEGSTMDFFVKGQEAATFSRQINRTLSQIEQTTGFIVKPKGVVLEFRHGGFVVYEENGHGLVAAVTDLGNKMDWNSANTDCEELVLFGYDDWHLPTKVELNSLYTNLKKLGVGGFESAHYWSASAIDDYQAWEHNFLINVKKIVPKNFDMEVRAVRSI